jgi:hypothetical protein
MATINQARFFTKDINEEFKKKISKIDSEIDNMQLISHDATENDFQRIRSTVFRNLWLWPNAIIQIDKVTPSNKTINLTPEDALELLFPGRSQIANEMFEATQVIYNVPVSGNMNALDLSKNGGSNIISFFGSTNGTAIQLYFFTPTLNQESGKIIKEKKDELLGRIIAILNLNEEYLSLKVGEFKKHVDDLIDLKYKRALEVYNKNSYL